MNVQEKELVTRFLEQLKSAQAGPKDPEAEALIREACARQPDAAYLLVQRTVQLEELLHASQGEVQKLKRELDQTPQPTASRGFLSDPNAWGKSGAAPPAQSAPQQAAVAPAPAAAAAPPARGGSWGSGLFGNIASTAAGVVAGSFLFQGIQGLMHRGDHPDSPAMPPAVPEHQALADGPELLNTYETPPDQGGETYVADSDDGGDFA